MCFFFRAHRARLAQFLVPQACFLNETPAGFQRLYVPVNLELNRLLHETYGVQVLQLDFCPEDIVALAAYRHVSFAAKVPFFHVRFGCAHPLQRPADMIDIIVSLPGRTKVGFSDDLSQRSRVHLFDPQARMHHPLVFHHYCELHNQVLLRSQTQQPREIGIGDFYVAIAYTWSAVLWVLLAPYWAQPRGVRYKWAFPVAFARLKS